jgi:hypothetical protein
VVVVVHPGGVTLFIELYTLVCLPHEELCTCGM